MTALTLDGVSVSLAGRPVLEDIDLEIVAGSWVGIVGPNGAGKTTLLRAMAGTVPYAGSMSIDGQPTESLGIRRRARSIALVPQRPEIPEGMSVTDYVLLGRAPHQGYFAVESTGDLRAVDEALASLELAKLAARTLGSLSGGELQRVVLARALAQSAPIMLLDEPTTSLDVGHQQQLLALVDDMRRSSGLTVVAAIHDLTLAAQFCDRLVMLAGGRVVSDGPAPHVLTESAIRRHYGARVRIISDDDLGVVVIPVRDSAHVTGRDTMSAHE
jgi:iron complex transport system ATP-binding protein